MKTHVWKKSRLPQCLTITGTLPSSTFPNRAFVNRKEEFFQAIVRWALWKESLPSVPSIYFCVVFISCHHKPTCSCTMNWTEELIWLKTHTAERGKKKVIFQQAQFSDLIYQFTTWQHKWLYKQQGGNLSCVDCCQLFPKQHPKPLPHGHASQQEAGFLISFPLLRQFWLVCRCPVCHLRRSC